MTVMITVVIALGLLQLSQSFENAYVRFVPAHNHSFYVYALCKFTFTQTPTLTLIMKTVLTIIIMLATMLRTMAAMMMLLNYLVRS